MTHPIKLFLFPFLVFTGLCFPQTIKEINITGNRVFNTSQITDWLHLSPSMKINQNIPDSSHKNLLLNFAAAGYLNSVISISTFQYKEDTTGVVLNVDVDEGEPTFVKNVFIEPDDSNFILESLPYFSFIEGEIFNKDEIEESINNTLTLFENTGYPFIKVRISSVHLYDDSLSENHFADIYLDIDPGEMSRIDKIEIRGNGSTADYVITRELRIEKGEIYNQQRIEELPNRLNRLRFFEPVPTPQFYLNTDGEGVLLIEIKEKQTNNFDGIIGYIPPKNDNEKGYLTGLVNVSLRNLFGTGRAAAIRWQQFDRNSQELQLKYLEPWFLGYPFNINAELYQRKQDTIYVQREVEGAIEYLATEDISASVFVASESIIPTESVVPVFTVFNSSLLTTGVSLKFDTRDDPYAPTEGLLFINSYSYSQKNINGPVQFISPQTETDIDLQRISLSFNIFLQLFSRQIIAVGVNGRELRGSSFEDSDLFRLGGTNSLRGYREDQFFGSRILWSNFEYRFLLSRRTYFFGFFDTGYYLRNEDKARNIFKQEDFLYGYGLGLNLETALGVLSVSFALGEGDSFSEGKIHFGIVNEF